VRWTFAVEVPKDELGGVATQCDLERHLRSTCRSRARNIARRWSSSIPGDSSSASRIILKRGFEKTRSDQRPWLRTTAVFPRQLRLVRRNRRLKSGETRVVIATGVNLNWESMWETVDLVCQVGFASINRRGAATHRTLGPPGWGQCPKAACSAPRETNLWNAPR